MTLSSQQQSYQHPTEGDGVTHVTPWCCFEQREELLEERACVPTDEELLFHSLKNAPGSAFSSFLSGSQVNNFNPN